MLTLHDVRTSMGSALSSIGQADGADGVVNDDYWYVLSGSPSPDWNLAVIYGADPVHVQAVVDAIDAAGNPALVMLAGDAAASTPPALDGWNHVADMPVMAIEAPFPGASRDPRVRLATPADFEANLNVLCGAFGMSPENSRGPLTQIFDTRVPLETWVLEQDGELVSSVIVMTDGSVGSVWCMATPAEHQRKGYGSALLRTVLAEAMDRGVQVCLLGATPAGYQMYSATGWTTVEHWKAYAKGHPEQFGD
jgi:ribosomal protein S18 acetylase RimI-like enzyme